MPSTFFVAQNGQDVAGGGGQGNPFGTIQFAVNTANSGDTIKVAAGTYVYNPRPTNFKRRWARKSSSASSASN